ncbi:hypothetical protein BH11PAT4_BH11PAT4_3750 [soil metagenome]
MVVCRITKRSLPLGKAACGEDQNNMNKPFGQICFENCVVPFGMLTIRGCGSLADLLGSPLTLSGAMEEYEVTESNALHEFSVSQATAKGDALPIFAADFIKQYAASPLRKSWKGDVKDTGRRAAHGLMLLSSLRAILGYFHSGNIKGQVGVLKTQNMIQLFRKKTPDQPARQTIAGKMKYALGTHRGTKDKMLALSDDTLLEVHIWVNPTEDGWFRINFVIENWFAPDSAPADVEMLTWNGKPLEFTLEVINNEEDGQHELLTLQPEWLMQRLSELLTTVQEELDAQPVAPPVGGPSPQFAARV